MERLLFGFEGDYREDLRLIPVGMRYRLDLAGVKLKLDAWLGIPIAERFALLAMPVDTEKGKSEFRASLRDAAPIPFPDSLPPVDPRTWSEKGPIPVSVTTACSETGDLIRADI